jgi:predicted transcriptional regulator of viral defense system
MGCVATNGRFTRGFRRWPHVVCLEAVLWPHRARGVISHVSALDLHDLCDVNPAHIDITLWAGYRVTRAPPRIYRLHHRDLQPADIALHEGIPVVTPRRAILGGIEAHLGYGLIRQAIDTASRHGLITRAQARQIERELAAGAR